MGGGAAYEVRATSSSFEVTPARPGDAGASRAATPIRLEIERIARGTRPLGGTAAAARARVEPDGHLAFDRGEVVEHLRNRPEGTELSFSFERPPAGTGDLIVHLGVSGQEHVGETLMGHHFADRGAGLGVRVGRATWIDARGQRTDVPVRRAAGGLAIEVAARVVDATAYPAILDPVVSPEIEIDAPIPSGAVGPQSVIGFACDGDLCLAVSAEAQSGETRYYATRMTSDGAVLDPTGIPLNVDGPIGGGSPMAVAAGEGQFLVVVQAPAGPPDRDLTQLRGMRVGADGALLDPGGFLIASSGSEFHDGARHRVSATFAGGNFLVAWNQLAGTAYPPHFNIRAARISPAAMVLDTDGELLVSDAQMEDVEGSGDGAYLLWLKDDVLFGSSLDAALGLLDPAGMPFAAIPASDPWITLAGAVAFGGDHYNVVWSSSEDRQARLLRLSLDGALLDDSPHLVGDAWWGLVIDAAASGSTLFVLRGEYEEDYGFTLFLSRWREEPTPPASDTTELGAFLPSKLAATSSEVMAAWTEYDSVDGPAILHAAPLRPEGEPFASSPSPFIQSANAQQSPAVAWDGSNYLVVWEDSRQSASDGARYGIYGARVSPAGEILDTPAIAIAGASTSTSPFSRGYPTLPRAFFDGTNFLVSWYRCDGVDGFPVDVARVSPLGVVLDDPPLEIPWLTRFQYNVENPVPAFDGGAFFMLSRWENSIEEVGVLRLYPDGTFSEPQWVDSLTLDAGLSVAADLVHGDGGYLQLITSRDASADFRTLFGVLLSRDATAVTAARFPIVNQLGVWSYWTTCFVDGMYLLLWEVRGERDKELRMTRITAAGEVLDPEGIPVAWIPNELVSGAMSITPSFGGALLAWERGGAGRRGAITVEGALFEITSGTVGPVFTIAEATHTEKTRSFALASADDGSMVVAVQRFIDGLPYNASRVRVRVLGEAVSGSGGSGGAGGAEGGSGGDDSGSGGDDSGGGGAAQGGSGPAGPISFGGCGCHVAGGDPAPGSSAMLFSLGLIATGLWGRRRGLSRAG